MPLTHVSLLKGKSPEYCRAIADAVCTALHEAFGSPVADRFVTMSEHEPATFVYAADYMGVQRSDDLVIIRVVANRGRSVEQKKALYAALAARLSERPGISANNVFVNIVEVDKENWSFGAGVAQLV